jgi:type IX secretion system PorP/SprF family membrane protein
MCLKYYVTYVPMCLKKNPKMKYFTLFINILCIKIVFAQDIHFTQNASSPHLNPALTGMIPGGYDWRVVATHRDQWTSVLGDGKYQTSLLSLERRFYVGNDDFWAIGSTISHDIAGKTPIRHLAGNVSASYIKLLHEGKSARHYLSAGAQTGVTNLQFDPSVSTWSKQFTGENYNTTLPSGEIFSNNTFENQLYGDLGTGIAYHYLHDARPPNEAAVPYATVGFTLQHVGGWIKSNYYNASILDKYFFIQPLWRVHATTLFNIKRSWYIMPTFAFSRQSKVKELNVGLFLKTDWNTTSYERLNAFQMGVIARANTRKSIDAIAPTIRLDIENFICGISYDLNLSTLSPASQVRGGFEFSLMYRAFLMDANGKRRGRGTVICRF